MDEDEMLGFGLSEVSIAPVPAKPEGRNADPEFCKFRDDVYATLHSQIKGYADICDLMRCYYSDTGHDPLAMVQKFGFNSFNEFITSDEMKPYVNIVASSSHEVSYHAAERTPFMHIRKEQMESFHNVCVKRSQREGICGAQRIRPKLFEVTRMSHNGMSFGVDGTATAPDILSRPGPAANRRIYDTSAWDGGNAGCGSSNVQAEPVRRSNVMHGLGSSGKGRSSSRGFGVSMPASGRGRSPLRLPSRHVLPTAGRSAYGCHEGSNVQAEPVRRSNAMHGLGSSGKGRSSSRGFGVSMPASGRRDILAEVCNCCGSPNHIVSRCPVDVPSRAGYEINNKKCLLCGLRGHFAVDCYQRKGKGSDCFKCGGQGHRSVSCSQSRGLRRDTYNIVGIHSRVAIYRKYNLRRIWFDIDDDDNIKPRVYGKRSGRRKWTEG